MNDLFGFGGNLFLAHFNVCHIFDNTADTLFFINVENNNVKQPFVLADVFAADVLLQVQRGGKQIGEIDEVAQVGAAEIFIIINIGMLFINPESIAELVVIFNNIQFGIGNDDWRGNTADQRVGFSLGLVFHVRNAHFRLGFAFEQGAGKVAAGVIAAAAAVEFVFKRIFADFGKHFFDVGFGKFAFDEVFGCIIQADIGARGSFAGTVVKFGLAQNFKTFGQARGF